MPVTTMLTKALDALVDDFAGQLVHDPLVIDVLALIDATQELRRVPSVSLDGLSGAKLEAPRLVRLSAPDAIHGHRAEGTARASGAASRRASHSRPAAEAMSERTKHVALVIGWWLVFFGLAGQFGTEQGRDNAVLPILLLGWIAFGVWRVVLKYRRRR